MSKENEPSDLELAALISSKICHDVIGGVGAIVNGFEMLDEEEDPDSQAYALDVIRSFTNQVSAKLQFARFAFGASGSAGAAIELATAEQIARGFVELGKQRLVWKAPSGAMAKDKVKLLLNMIASAITALPHGGEIIVTVTGTPAAPGLEVLCRGRGARPPMHLGELLAGGPGALDIDVFSIQPYYMCRLAALSGMALDLSRHGEDIVLAARPAALRPAAPGYAPVVAPRPTPRFSQS